MDATNLQPEIITTADGSHSLYNSTIDETYHSRHGALQESKYVFIEQGLKQVEKDPFVVQSATNCELTDGTKNHST